MKALFAVASIGGVSSGGVGGGEEEVDEMGELVVTGEVGEGKPELPGAGRE